MQDKKRNHVQRAAQTICKMQERNNLQTKLAASQRTCRDTGQAVNSISWLASTSANLSPVPISLGLIMNKSHANACTFNVAGLSDKQTLVFM